MRVAPLSLQCGRPPCNMSANDDANNDTEGRHAEYGQGKTNNTMTITPLGRHSWASGSRQKDKNALQVLWPSNVNADEHF